MFGNGIGLSNGRSRSGISKDTVLYSQKICTTAKLYDEEEDISTGNNYGRWRIYNTYRILQ